MLALASGDHSYDVVRECANHPSGEGQRIPAGAGDVRGVSVSVLHGDDGKADGPSGFDLPDELLSRPQRVLGDGPGQQQEDLALHTRKSTARIGAV